MRERHAGYARWRPTYGADIDKGDDVYIGVGTLLVIVIILLLILLL